MPFYVIDTKPKGSAVLERYRTDFEYDDSVLTGDAPRCPKCGAFIGMLESLPPYWVHLEAWGESVGDFAFWMNEFLVTRRFRDAYQLSGLKGITNFEPVTVLSHHRYGRDKESPPEYFRVLPASGAARVDAAASNMEWEGDKLPTCDLCLSGGGTLRRRKRLVIDQSSWNGDDVFYAFGAPGVLIISSRFFEWATELQLRNFIAKPVADYSYDIYPGEVRT